MPDDDIQPNFGTTRYVEQDASKTTLDDLFFETGAQLVYTYDFSDCCTHLMTYLGRRNGSVACYDTEGVYVIDDAYCMKDLLAPPANATTPVPIAKKKEWLNFLGSSPEEVLYMPTCLKVTSQMLVCLHMISAEQYFADA